MQAKKTKRGYDASRRRASSDERRGRILQTARNLFGHYGYGATSIERIAGEAGVAGADGLRDVSIQASHAVALLDQADAQADVAGLLRDLHATAGDPRKQLAPVGFLYVPLLRAGGRHCRDRTRRRLYERRPSGLVAGRRGAATPRPKALTDAWDRAGVLRKSHTAKEALDILWAMTGADHYRLFVVDRKWSAARYEAWLENTLERLLLR